MTTNPWARMSISEQSIALAEKLGWHKVEREWRTRDNRFRIADADWLPQSSYFSMWLIWEAMQEEGWGHQLSTTARGHTLASFFRTPGFGSGSAKSEPLAVAEAAWKALGGK